MFLLGITLQEKQTLWHFFGEQTHQIMSSEERLKEDREDMTAELERNGDVSYVVQVDRILPEEPC